MNKALHFYPSWVNIVICCCCVCVYFFFMHSTACHCWCLPEPPPSSSLTLSYLIVTDSYHCLLHAENVLRPCEQAKTFIQCACKICSLCFENAQKSPNPQESYRQKCSYCVCVCVRAVMAVLNPCHAKWQVMKNFDDI